MKKNRRRVDVRSAVPLFSGVPLLSLIFLQISNHQTWEILSSGSPVPRCEGSYTSWSSLTQLTLFPPWPEASTLWENVGLDQQAPSPRSATSSHLCLLPLQLSLEHQDCSPLLLQESVSGRLVATARVELLKTTTAFSFAGSIDLCACTKTHGIQILSNKVAVVLVLTDCAGSAFMDQDVFGGFFSRMGSSALFCWTLISFQYPSTLLYLQNIYLEDNWRESMSKHHKARSWWFQRRKWKSLLYDKKKWARRKKKEGD